MERQLISVITPTNGSPHLYDAYLSLLAQTYANWEWIVLANGGAQNSPELELLTAPRVKLLRQEVEVDRIGALKYQCARAAGGAIVVELDHDDLLVPSALSRIEQAFRESGAGMVFSNCVRVDSEGRHVPFAEGFGWQYRSQPVAAESVSNHPDHSTSIPSLLGQPLTEVVSPEPWPQNLSRIWYAPDHVRAWKASEYWRIGGHDQSLRVGDDHDLICRFYLESSIHHINEPLYIYRITGTNSWLANCDAVQEQQWRNYDRYIEKMALKWAGVAGLKAIDLCGGIDPRPGYIPVDISLSGAETQTNSLRHIGIEADLNKRWPFEDGSVGVIRAIDAIEHLRSPIHTMNEAWRVLAHGGFFIIEVPSTDGRGAFQDPTHVSFWNENSFWYYTRSSHLRYIQGAGANCRFQVLRLRTYFPNEYCRANNIPYVQAHLIAIKQDAPRYHGPLGI